MDNSKDDLINYIDTSDMTTNVVGFSRNFMQSASKEELGYEDKIRFGMLEQYSLAVQFAVKTHDKELSNDEVNKFSLMQKDFESQTSESIRNYKAIYTKLLKVALAGSVFVRALIGSLFTWWVLYA